MHPHDPRLHGTAGDIPELPIPRPDVMGGDPAQPVDRRPIAPPSLGASFTKSSGQTGSIDGQPIVTHDTRDDTPEHDLQLMTWELAARLTAGMLSNPAVSNGSVKDAMALFDKFLHEMNDYVHLSAEYEMELADDRRRAHVSYFRPDAQDDSSDSYDPGHGAGAGTPPHGRPTPQQPRPLPQQPRPDSNQRRSA